MADNDFKIDEFGQIHRENVAEKSPDDALWAEYQKLEYEIFSHHDQDAAKMARYRELKKQLGIDVAASANAFDRAREKIRAQMAGKNLSVAQLLEMANQQKE